MGEDWTLKELKEECKTIGVSEKGKKADLIKRIEEHRSNNEVVNASPVEETPAEETPVEETPVEETPAEETPIEETPAEETPVQEALAEEPPLGDTLPEKMPA